MKTLLIDAVNTFIIKGEWIDQNIYQIIQQYPDIQNIIVTNADYQQDNLFGLCDMPYPVFTGKKNPHKSDPSYYQLLYKTHNLNPQDIIYIEHNIDAIKSAQQNGINKTYHFDPLQKNYDKLDQFLKNHLTS